MIGLYICLSIGAMIMVLFEHDSREFENPSPSIADIAYPKFSTIFEDPTLTKFGKTLRFINRLFFRGLVLPYYLVYTVYTFITSRMYIKES